MIELKNVWKAYKNGTSQRWVLRDFNLVVPTGERLVIMGGNGAGKSTVVNLLATGTPASGRILVCGDDVTKMPAHERSSRIARLTQTPGEDLSDALSIAEHFALALSKKRSRHLWRGVTEETRRHARECLSSLRPDLGSRIDSQIGEFSGGERQLVALALVTAAPPSVLILDEPTSALDVSSRSIVQRAAMELISTLRLTSVWITHDVDEALRVASRIVVMAEGVIVEDFSRAEAACMGRDGLAMVLAASMGRPVGESFATLAEAPSPVGSVA